MSYRKHVQIVRTDQRLRAELAKQARDINSATPAGSNNKFSSYLPEVYAGHPMRIERYAQYDQMDMDSEVNAALDTISDFSVQKDPKTDEYFSITYHGEMTEGEIEVLKTCLRQWSRINDWKKRVWRIFRSVLKYGDQFFIRDPETLKWFWVSPTKVDRIIVNEADGKEPEAYIFRDLDINLKSFTATAPDTYGHNLIGGQGTNTLQQRPTGQSLTWTGVGSNRNSRFTDGSMNLVAVDATHVVHLSLSEGLDENWPFGTSILESVFKVFRQKELLEDAIIIYRIQRAPERRVFYIDVGSMPPHKAGAYVEKVKNDINQRRFPTRTGGGASITDATYNPMSIMEDFFFPQTSEGRGSRVETLPGGESLGQIDDLRYWTNKLLRGLRVPSSYLPTGPEDGSMTYNDSRVGTSYIQEYRFAEYCERLQNLIASVFDDEFKLFVKRRGGNIDSSLYELNFNTPQNFSSYAEIDRMSARINNFQPLMDIPYLSKRWLMKNVLGMTEDDILSNEAQWREENQSKTKGTGAEFIDNRERSAGLSAVGIRNSDFMGDDSDFEDEVLGLSDDGSDADAVDDAGADEDL